MTVPRRLHERRAAAPAVDPQAAADAVRAASRVNTQQFREGLPMIASENIVSPRVAELLASDLHGRYAEGLPGKRYYQGCKPFDEIETLGIDLAKQVFDCSFANIQSTSGTNSNLAVLKALTRPGDTITAVSTADGGHISHAPMGAVGMRGLDLHTYPWDEETMTIDVDQAVRMIRKTKPRLALFGQSMILFPTPMDEVAEAAHDEGGVVMYDGAHVLGLIAGGCFQDPLREGADVMTGSSHKTFPGPQGGFVLSNSDDEQFQRKLNTGVFPGVCSNYHLHHCAGKVVALAEFMAFGKDYARDIVANAKALAEALAEKGIDVLGEARGYTASHQVVTRHGDPDDASGARAAGLLEDAGIITNMNMLPGDTKPMRPSGLRMGVQELTRIGCTPGDMVEVAGWFRDVLLDNRDPAKVADEIRLFRADKQHAKYCFDGDSRGAYEDLSLITQMA